MTKTVISTSEAPQAIGPYSQAVSFGDFVFCSGQVALDPATGELVGDGVGEQARRCMENLRAVLAAAGTNLDRIVKTTIFLTDMNDFVEVNEAYGSFFSSDPPARATVAVVGLPKGARVEIECLAAL
ncbi:MAG: 2-iminobutanoate/2-iminopropanoate deaminase [Actinomycetota bacterium]|nr:2-iminobutanoate/2-iminopropanoate deaminase [Actinomycetota bacterium]